MKRFSGAIVFLLGLLLIFGAASWAGNDEAVKALMDARTAVKPAPLPSAMVPDLSTEKAYAIQKSLAKAILAKGDRVSGFKAGLTSEAGQKKFGMDKPLLGPLFKSGELAPAAAVDPKQFNRLFIETEIGYVVGRKISEPVKDVDALKTMISEVFPAVELPDIRFADMKNLKGTDLVCDAVGCAQYIVGKKVPVSAVDVSQVTVTLNLDGKEVNQGKAADAMGDQWKALLWLVNGAVSEGWTLEPGHILITGAMGNMIPGKPGSYEGNWGPLGKLSWSVK
ncbi:MAG: fumarylacetoacetate hydrolase family protein [Desulfomonile tiedjei]|nr:fumarylacetoacetate hydrolase family protein [Desulfomonile tiedjei]